MSEKSVREELLAETAGWTAAVRAMESERADSLFHDPLAARLAGPQGAAWAADRPAPSVAPIVIRTRFFDDFLSTVTNEGGVRQVVILAAGFDTRAFRIEWPQGTVLFEVDQPRGSGRWTIRLNSSRSGGGNPALFQSAVRGRATEDGISR